MGDYSNFIEQCSEELEFFKHSMCNEPKISVVITAYNAEEFIYDCLMSVVKQTFDDIEIVIVNDGSTDNTFSIIKTFMQYDKRIKLINKANNGVGRAKNDGLNYAAGECVIFLDSDDVIKNNFVLENLYHVYVKNNVDVVVFGASNFKNNKYSKSSYGIEKVPNIFINKILNHDDIEKILFKIPVLGVCKFYKRSFLLKNGICFQEGCIGEDQIFHIKSTLLADKLYIINKNYYGYRRSIKNSLTFSKRKKDNSVILNFYAIENFLQKTNFPPKLINRILILYFEKCVSWLGKCEDNYRDEYFKDLCLLLKFIKLNYPEFKVEFLKLNQKDKYIILKLKLFAYNLRRIINVRKY